MTTSEIEVLLRKYYDGETSLEEELALSDFFNSGQVPEYLDSHKYLFIWANREKKKKMDKINFEASFESKIDVTGDNRIVRRKRGPFIARLAVAASVLILIGLIFIRITNTNQQPLTVSQPSVEEAWSATSGALTMVSMKFNVGLAELSKINQFDHAVHNLDSFNKFFRSQNTVINTEELYGASQNTD
jgi:hypothetical protein